MEDSNQGTAGQVTQKMPLPTQPVQQPNMQAPVNPNQVTFLSVIKDSNSILVLLPTNPNFDQIAGGLSLFLSLQKHKATQVFSPTPMTVAYNRLIGIDKIAHELGNKNLIVRFSNYDATNIEKVSYDIEEGNQFKLTVIPKGDLNPPTKDQINVGYSGVSVDTVILIGGTDESSFPLVSANELQSANIIHVGIKQISLASKKNFISFTRIGSSISEIIYGLVRENQLYIDPDISTNLLMGVEELVGDNFQAEGVTAETFYTFADLMQYGAKRHSNKGVEGNFPPGSIPGQLPTFNQHMTQPAGMQTQNPQSGLWGQQAQPMQPLSQPQSQTQTQAQPQSEPKIEDVRVAEEPIEVTDENAPEEWKQPKIYKGGSSNS